MRIPVAKHLRYQKSSSCYVYTRPYYIQRKIRWEEAGDITTSQYILSRELDIAHTPNDISLRAVYRNTISL